MKKIFRYNDRDDLLNYQKKILKIVKITNLFFYKILILSSRFMSEKFFLTFVCIETQMHLKKYYKFFTFDADLFKKIVLTNRVYTKVVVSSFNYIRFKSKLFLNF